MFLSTITFATFAGIASFYHLQGRRKDCELLEKENRLLKDRTETMGLHFVAYFYHLQ